MRRFRKAAGFGRAAVGLTAVLALAATAGCSSNGAGSTDGSSDEVVKIGLPLPLTGVWADSGQNAVDGAMLAIDEINEAGGIEALGGAKLEGITADTGSTDPGQAATVTRELIEREEVRALVGSYVTAFTTTSSTEAERSGIPIITQSFADALSERDYQYFFQLAATSSSMGSSVIRYVQESYAEVGVDISDVAVLASNDAAIQTQGEAAIKQVEEDGLNLVFDTFYPQDLSDATVMVQSALATDPDVILLGGPTGAAVAIIQAIRSLGFDGPIVGLGGGGIPTPQFGELLGDDVNGVMSQVPWNWDMFPELEAVNDRYAEAYDLTFMPQEAGLSYVAVWALADAMEQTGSSEPEDIAEALRTMTFDEGPAALMPGSSVSFDETGKNEVAYPVLVQWQEGKTRSVWPSEIQIAQPQ